MSISPVSFKGSITVRTQKTPDAQVETRTYKTTKKQDGEILKTTVEIMPKSGFRGEIYGKNAEILYKKLESITGQEILRSGSVDNKALYIGGNTNSDVPNSSRYDYSYNKIFLKDMNYSGYPHSEITVDLMDPKERKVASKETFENIRGRIMEMFAPTDGEWQLVIQTCNLSDKKAAKTEEILSKTLYYLDGNKDKSNYEEKAPELNSPYEAYETLLKNLLPVVNKEYYEVLYNDVATSLKEEDYANVKRAVGYLQEAVPELTSDK